MSLICEECKKEMKETEITEELSHKLIGALPDNIMNSINRLKKFKVPEKHIIKALQTAIKKKYKLFLCDCGCYELKDKSKC